MHRGYIKFWRCCQDNSLYFEDKFSRWQAWQDLILLANWEDGVYLKRSVKFEVKRGMLAWSTKGLADRWGWSRSKVDRFLKYLENEHQIEHQKNTITTLITIINYDKYQERDNKTNIKRTSNEHQTNTSKESKESKESKLSGGNGKFKVPKIEEIREYCQERKNGIDAEKFFHHYEANGWVRGKANTPIKKWKSVVVQWEKYREEDEPPKGAILR